MRLLLDTCALLWFVEGNAALSARARTAIEDGNNQRFVSHATAWEIAIKLNVRKLTLNGVYSDIFPNAIAANGFQMLVPRFEHYLDLLRLPMHHRDPFDRLLISQARVEGLTVVTRDAKFFTYGIPILWD